MLDLQAYLNRLASAQPTPGGGSAATIVGALGAALVAMVARITLGNPKHADVHAEALLLVGAADSLRARFGGARSADEAAYAAVPEAQALPRASAAETALRTERLQTALAGAADAPLHAAELAATLLALCERAAALRNLHLMSDVECALGVRARCARSVRRERARQSPLHERRAPRRNEQIGAWRRSSTPGSERNRNARR